MKKKILIWIFLILTSINSADFSYSYDKIEENWKNIFSEIKKENIWKMSKKEIKKDIKIRKKYHKKMLENYNKNFDEKILEFIKENSIILKKLKEELKK